MKNSLRKGCKVFDVHVMNNAHMNKEDKLKFNDIPMLQAFSDVFLEDILILPPKKRIGF